MEYHVLIDNEESNVNADNLSLTGRVNGVNCAVVIRLTSLQGLDKKKVKLEKQKALIQAFLNRASTVVASAGEKVEL